MLVDPDLNEIVTGTRGMLKGIDACIGAQCLVSAVALVYSSIDALSALTRPTNAADTTRDVFMAWVTKYMQPEHNLGCTAPDVYGARCGVLHSYATNSRMRRMGAAKAIIYKWRSGPDPDPMRKVPLPADAITIYVEDLRRTLGTAVGGFFGAIDAHPELKARVEYHRQELLCYRPWQAIQIRVAA